MTSGASIARQPVLSESSEFVPDLTFHRAASRSARSSASSSPIVTVGGISVRLSGLGPHQASALKRRYGIFCRPPGEGADLRVSVRSLGLPGFLSMRRRGEYYRVETRREGAVLLVCSYEWAGWLDTQRGEGGLALAEIARTNARAFDRAIENFLRVACAHLVIPRGGFLLHAAGLVLGERAWLFFGPSGAGKTTVATLTPEALVLSDDLTLVLKSPGGDYRACSVPFRGLLAPEPASDRSYPLAGFFRLVQDRVDRVEPVQGARAVGELLGSLPFVTEEPEIAGDATDNVADAAAKVPVFRLHFRKDRTFWQEILSKCPVVDGFSAPGGY